MIHKKLLRVRRYLRFLATSLPSFYYQLKGQEFVRHSLQVTSFGGTGTSLLNHFLKQFCLDTPYERDAGKWKHLRMPPGLGENLHLVTRSSFRVVYLTGCPMNTVISLFRRKLHHHHVGRMGIRGRTLDRDMTLEEYLEIGEDVFSMHEHLNNWVNSPVEGRSYPIMVLKHDAMWTYLDELFDFLEIPRSRLASFPRKEARQSDWTTQPPHVREKLLRIYGPLSDKVNALPDRVIV